VLNHTLTAEDTDLVESLFGFYDIRHLMDKKFLEISSGEQRLMLLMRSLIKNPDLIIWDEPFQGLDEKFIQYSTLLLQEFCKSTTTLIFTTHYFQEIPPFVNQFLFLETGKISQMILQ
jgi:molybdate transport system ATP-binding protein